MRTSIWYHTADQQPALSGFYLCYRGFGMGGMSDYDNSHGYLWFENQTNAWYEYEDCERGAIVYYWTDADPVGWVDTDPPVVHRKKSKGNPALEIAWNRVQEAVRQYEIVKGLVG